MKEIIKEIIYKNGLFHYTQLSNVNSTTLDETVAKAIKWEKEINNWCNQMDTNKTKIEMHFNNF
jgi:uncharacterized protein YhaN